jgi:hypothetical protein
MKCFVVFDLMFGCDLFVFGFQKLRKFVLMCLLLLQVKFDIGELAWAQYRMDGLWYAVRIETVSIEDVGVEYIDYDLSDTLPPANVCPDYEGLLTGERINPIKAFDSRPTQELLKGIKHL